MERGGFDVMFLIEKKISTTTYCRNRLGDDMTSLAARPSSAGGAQGGVGLVTRLRPAGWGIESTHYHRPNVVSCKIITRLTQTPLIDA